MPPLQLDLAPDASSWLNVGTIVAPEALGVGTHTAHVATFDPAPGATFDAVFAIDVSGTGASLLS